MVTESDGDYITTEEAIQTTHRRVKDIKSDCFPQLEKAIVKRLERSLDTHCKELGGV